MRLIDGDALLETIEDHCTALSCCLTVEQWRGKNDMKRQVIEDIHNAPTVGGWISVKDRLPEEKENQYTKDYQEVLCVLKTRFGTDVRVYKFGKGHFWNGSQEIDWMISHWMPFPELPKEEQNEAD